MNKTKALIVTFLTLLVLNACSSITEGLGGTKKKGSDEFLIEKKAPLVLPPSYGELPEPGTKIDKNITSKENTSSIEKIINQSSSVETNKEDNDLNNSIEKTIIEKINMQKIKLVNVDKVIEGKKEIIKKKNFFQKLKEKFNKQ
tara:strand:- start:240 stop:671 length:432 start_codon:yes stop_codon:yes gene_type:complete